MDTILASSKTYEYIRDKADPVYADMVIATEIVKTFISDKKLILYGGSAIDFALRLRGDKIYDDSMLAVPDLDFYSPDSVGDSYKLADILYHAGFTSVRVIRAMYVRTMRVDLISGHIIADITYCPQSVFDRLPKIAYDNMFIVDPIYQRADLHASLSFPYDNPPTEVIFDRWNKDVKRFNLLDKYYPMKDVKAAGVAPRCSVPATVRKYVMTGVVAYNMLKGTAAYTATEFTFNGTGLDLVHFDIDKCAAELGLKDIVKYEPYVSLVPEYLEGKLGDVPVRVYSTKNKLITVNSMQVDGATFRIVNVQPLLRHFIALVNRGGDDECIMIYSDLLKMIQAAEAQSLAESPLYPSIYTYGADNYSLAYLVLKNSVLHDLGEEELYILPKNYYPERSIPKGMPHPPFDYADSEFFKEEGKIESQ